MNDKKYEQTTIVLQKAVQKDTSTTVNHSQHRFGLDLFRCVATIN